MVPVALLAVVAVLGTSRGVRRAVLSSAGRALVAQDPIEQVDVIVVSVAAGGEGVLEAADLFHAGIASRVAVFAEFPDASDREFTRRHIPFENETERSIRRLHALSVDHVEVIDVGAVTGTASEGEILPEWCDRQGIGAVVVVTTSDHSRRLRRVLRRAMNGHRARALVRPAHYSRFDPETWWTYRDGVRIEIVELEKLLLDVAGHPLS